MLGTIFGHETRPRAFAADVAEIERRMRAIEGRLERMGRSAGRQASAALSDTSDHVGEVVSAAVNDIIDRFRGGTRTVSGEAVRFGNQAVRYGNEAAKLSNDMVRKLAHEAEHRPLVTLAVAVGVGVLIGMAGRRH